MAARSTFRAFGLMLGLLVTAVLSLTGCNTVDSAADSTIAEQRMARPAAIVVQPFAISPDAPAPTGRQRPVTTPVRRQAGSANPSQPIWSPRSVSMGLPAIGADAPLPPGGSVMTLEGTFVSVPGGDFAEPAIVSLANSWPDVVVDVEIYDTSDAGDRLLEDMEFRLTDADPLMPAGEPAGEPTEPQGSGAAGRPRSRRRPRRSSTPPPVMAPIRSPRS